MKRFVSLVVAIMLMCTFITGCSHTPKAVKEYKDWYEALQIEEHKGVEYAGFRDDDNEIALGIDCDDENLSEFNDVLMRHNRFVQLNPSYFSEDTKITIMAVKGTPLAFLDCYNKPGEYFGEISGIGIDENSEIKYLSANLFQLKAAYEKCSNEFSVSVLVLKTDDPESVHAEDLEFIKQFKDLKQVIIYYNALGYDMGPTLEGINEYLPGTEIYQVIDGGELKQWQ